MTPLERLLAEAIPDGTFGGPRHTPTAPDPPLVRETPRADPNAAAHFAELAAAIDKRTGRRKPRHLRALPAA